MPLRFGLAFSGGGFRGAYHAGFLLAMERHGLRPVAVSGASVGALNAVLLRYLSAEEMCRYWLERATFRSMYRIRPVGIAARAISLVLLLPWLLANVHGARDRPGNSRARMIADVEVGIGPDILYTAWRTPIFPVGYAAALAGAVAAALAALWDISWGAPFLILFLLFQAGPFAARWLERLNVTAFRSHAEARLGELIDGRIPRPGAATTFVSVGRVSLVFHYASITGWDSPSGPRRVGVRYLEWVDTGIFVPAGPRTTFVPDYVRIEAGADSAPMRAVAGAVALPLGLVGGSLYGRVIGRDSGSVDNVPVYPLLDLDLDEIVVVDISRAGWSRGAFLTKLPEVHRLMRTLAVCQGCLVDNARAIAYVNRHVARGSGDVLGVLSRNIIPAIDAEIGIDGRGPSVPGSTHIRPVMRASFITTLYANSRRRQQMIDEGYALGMELFSRWAAADEPKEREA